MKIDKTFEEENMPGFIEPQQWKTFLDDFTKRNQFRSTRLEIIGDIGAQEEEQYLPLVGVSLETKGTAAGSVEVILGDQTAPHQRRVEHLIEGVQRIAPLVGMSGFEDGLGFEAEGGRTLLTFEKLREIPDETSGKQPSSHLR